MPHSNHSGGFNGNGRDYPKNLSERMDRVRHDLQEDVAQLSAEARQVTDWRYYVRSHPWATAGLAAVVGYALVPTKKEVVHASADEISKLVREGRLQIVAEGQQSNKQGVVAATLLGVGTVAARAVMAYVGKRVGEKLENGGLFAHAPSE